MEIQGNLIGITDSEMPIVLAHSVCRCPENRVEITLGGKNEEPVFENNNQGMRRILL